MVIEPERRVGPPARCLRCKCLAECPIEFAGSTPDSNGTQMALDGLICETCWEISQKNLKEFFAPFMRKQG